MIYGITYSDHRMTRSASLCVGSMAKHGVNYPYQKSFADIDDEFWRLNKDIFDQNRGGGYWLWKPYIIYTMMTSGGIKDGDILIYADAGVEFVESVYHIIGRMDQDIFFFTNGFPHVEWCKGDVWQNINMDRYEFKPSDQLDDACWLQHYSMVDKDPLPKQVQASVIFFKVNQNTRNFVKEWLLYSQMPGFITDEPSKLPNFPTFAEHRHDQAILTCLQIKHGYKTHFWPTNYSEHIRHTAQPEDTYPTMFNHHRKRDPSHGNGEPEWPDS